MAYVKVIQAHAAVMLVNGKVSRFSLTGGVGLGVKHTFLNDFATV